MTYDESAALMIDNDFRGRVKVACLHYASYIMGEPTTTAAHNTRLRWANNCYLQPDQVAISLQPPVVMDPGVQSAGAAVDDPTLQSAVEDTINQLM